MQNCSKIISTVTSLQQGVSFYKLKSGFMISRLSFKKYFFSRIIISSEEVDHTGVEPLNIANFY